MDYRREAKELLTHYFRLAFEKADVKFDYDNQCEIDTIVDLIFDGVIAEIEKRLAQQAQ